MEYLKWDLQLLADGGAGDGAGASSATGVNADDAGLPSRLEALGVPRDKIEKRRAALERRSASQRTSQPQPQAPADTPAPKENEEAPAADEAAAQPAPKSDATEISRESMIANPQMKKIMDEYANEIVRNRVKNTGQDAENFRKLAPIIDTLAGYYGLDRANLDLDNLAQRVVGDDTYYEDRAIAEGRDVEDVRKAAVQAAQQQQLQEQTLRAHFDALRQQADVLKQSMPSFDLSAELRNPAFARMVSPGSLVSLEDAYFAVHRKEIQAAQQQQALEAASRSIQAGQARPVENGSTPQAAAPTVDNIRDKAYRDNLIRRIKEAAARGEKIYPGQ